MLNRQGRNCLSVTHVCLWCLCSTLLFKVQLVISGFCYSEQQCVHVCVAQSRDWVSCRSLELLLEFSWVFSSYYAFRTYRYCLQNGKEKGWKKGEWKEGGRKGGRKVSLSKQKRRKEMGTAKCDSGWSQGAWNWGLGCLLHSPLPPLHAIS